MASSTTTTAETHEHQLARLEAEVLALRGQLHRTHRLATVGTMAAMVAHEFNNILTPVINYAQLAQKNPKLLAKAAARAADGGARATAICNALLKITREDADRSVTIDAADLVNETLAAMGRDLARDSIDLDIDVPKGLALIAPRVELQQVLLNLILNARDALLARPAPRQMLISFQRLNGDVIVRVGDNGVGIPAENIDRIFEPFFTTHADDDSDGSGLGLAICHQIIHAIGGTISVESEPSKGATFTVTLPAHP